MNPARVARRVLLSGGCSFQLRPAGEHLGATGCPKTSPNPQLRVLGPSGALMICSRVVLAAPSAQDSLTRDPVPTVKLESSPSPSFQSHLSRELVSTVAILTTPLLQEASHCAHRIDVLTSKPWLWNSNHNASREPSSSSLTGASMGSLFVSSSGSGPARSNLTSKVDEVSRKVLQPSAADTLSSRASSTSSAQEASPGELELTPSCIQRLHDLEEEEGKKVVLRLSVEGGGCSGFQYLFTLEDGPKEGDRVFMKDEAKLVVDDITLGFVKGSKVDFTEELIRSAFQVIDNPNSASSCGCGASFVAKG